MVCCCTGACLRGEGCSARPRTLPWEYPYPAPVIPYVQPKPGWECPVCHHGNAPWMPYCHGCSTSATGGSAATEKAAGAGS